MESLIHCGGNTTAGIRHLYVWYDPWVHFLRDLRTHLHEYPQPCRICQPRICLDMMPIAPCDSPQEHVYSHG